MSHDDLLEGIEVPKDAGSEQAESATAKDDCRGEFFFKLGEDAEPDELVESWLRLVGLAGVPEVIKPTLKGAATNRDICTNAKQPLGSRLRAPALSPCDSLKMP